MTAPLDSSVRRVPEETLSGAQRSYRRCVHWETEGHLELVARGTAASTKAQVSYQIMRAGIPRDSYPLLDMVRVYLLNSLLAVVWDIRRWC